MSGLIQDLEAAKRRVEDEARVLRQWAQTNPREANRDADKHFMHCLTSGAYAKRRYRI